MVASLIRSDALERVDPDVYEILISAGYFMSLSIESPMRRVVHGCACGSELDWLPF